MLEALDDERGIGFGRDGHRSSDNSPLLAELPFPKRPSSSGWVTGWTKLSFQRLGPSCEGNDRVVALPSRHREPCSRRPAELARCSLCVRHDCGALAAGARLGRLSRADERRRRPVGSQLARVILPRRSDIARPRPCSSTRGGVASSRGHLRRDCPPAGRSHGQRALPAPLAPTRDCVRRPFLRSGAAEGRQILVSHSVVRCRPR